MYTTKEELSTLVAEWQRTGVMSRRLVEVLRLLQDGICSRVGTPNAERADAIQEFFLAVVKNRDKFNTSMNLFSYLTSVALRTVWKRHREKGRDRLRTNVEFYGGGPD